MRDDDWLTGLSRLERHGLSFDLRVPYWHLAEAASVAAPVSQYSHGAEPHRLSLGSQRRKALKAWRAAMESVARQPNMHLKISEFGLRDQPWDYDSNRAIVRDALAIFGVERCMFASEFPGRRPARQL